MRSLLVLAACCAPLLAWAQKAAPNLGLGSVPCDVFLEERQPQNLRNNHHYVQITWAQGFIAGLEQAQGTGARSYDTLALEIGLVGYCETHAGASLASAAQAFYAGLASAK